MNGKRVMKTKQPVALVALLLLLCCTVAGTLAYLVDSTDPVTNTFTPASVSTEVNEDFDGITKRNVTIKNTGNIDAYIRAAVIVNWANDAGEISGTPVTNADYSITYNTDANGDWFVGSDGYYYCKTSVKSEKQDAKDCWTPVLIESCTQKGTAPEGFHLQVTILADGIQSEPTSTVASVWTAIQVDTNGNLTAKN